MTNINQVKAQASNLIRTSKQSQNSTSNANRLNAVKDKINSLRNATDLKGIEGLKQGLNEITEVESSKQQLELIQKLESITQGDKLSITTPVHIDPKEEKQFSLFKTDFFTKQEEEMKAIQKVYVQKAKADPKNKEHKENLLEITRELKEVNDAKKFWSKEANFWTKLAGAKPSNKNQDQIDKLSFELTQLENQMDQILPNDGSRAQKAEAKGINKRAASVKAQIASLHSGI